jgi:hypothetical protein
LATCAFDHIITPQKFYLFRVWLTTSTPKLDDVPIIKPEEKPNLESVLTVSWSERGKLYFLGFSEKVGSVNVNCFMFI